MQLCHTISHLCGIISTVADLSDSGISHSSSELEADALVVIVVATPGLHLSVIAHRVSRGMARLLKRVFSRDRLRLPVVELALWVDMQPVSRVGVLVALDLAGLALPLVF